MLASEANKLRLLLINFGRLISWRLATTQHKIIASVVLDRAAQEYLSVYSGISVSQYFIFFSCVFFMEVRTKSNWLLVMSVVAV